VACGGGDNPTGPSTPNIAGTWRITWTNMAGNGLSCYTSPTPITLTQNGTTFTGTSNASWTLTCMSGAFQDSDTFVGMALSGGTINGNSVSFNMATADASNTGTLSGNTMSGQATWRFSTGTQNYVLNGNWAATRQ
jgi:hypothetical protein